MGASCGRFVQVYKHLRNKKHRASMHFGKRSEELRLDKSKARHLKLVYYDYVAYIPYYR